MDGDVGGAVAAWGILRADVNPLVQSQSGHGRKTEHAVASRLQVNGVLRVVRAWHESHFPIPGSEAQLPSGEDLYRHIYIFRYIKTVTVDQVIDASSQLKALGDPSRLILARLLIAGSFNVTELTRVLDAGQSTVSRNLRILVDADLLASRREGRLVFYTWRTDLAQSGLDLQDWVASHVPAIDGAVARRLQEVWDERRERSANFFTGDAQGDDQDAWLGSADCLPHLLQAVPDQGVVVDLGTGTGRILPELSRRAERIIAVDASPTMLDQARKRVGASGIGGVDFRLGDLAHLPLHDGEVDAVVANMVLHHAPEPAQAVAEIHRVLRPGGKLLLGDFLPHDQEWMRERFADQWLGFSISDISHWLGEAGFCSLSFESIPPPKEGAPGAFFASATRASGSGPGPLTPNPS